MDAYNSLLDQLHRQLQRLFLAARTPGQRVRIDAALAQVEQIVTQRARRRLRAQAPRLPARLSLQQAVLASLCKAQRNGAWVEEGRVRRVVDGDTIVLLDGERVRYLGIDAPEIFDGPVRRPVPEPDAHAAAEANRRWVEGRRVRLLGDRTERDRYGRLLRYVFCAGIFVNAQLLLDGFVRVCILPPDERFAALLVQCEQVARAGHLGLWQEGHSHDH